MLCALSVLVRAATPSRGDAEALVAIGRDDVVTVADPSFLLSNPRVLAATETSCSYANNAELLKNIDAACTRYAAMRAIINVYDAGKNSSGTNCLGTLPSCVEDVVAIEGFKPPFWHRALTPERVAGFDYVWLPDNDMEVHDFNLRSAVRMMRQLNLSLAQPRVTLTPDASGRPQAALRNGFWSDTHNPVARTYRGVSSQSGEDLEKTSGLLPLEPPGCRAQTLRWVDTQTPIFSVNAWVMQHEHLLSKLDWSFANRSDFGIMSTWCNMIADKLPDTPACAVLNETIGTTNGKTANFATVGANLAVTYAFYRDTFGDYFDRTLYKTTSRGKCLYIDQAALTADFSAEP